MSPGKIGTDAENAEPVARSLPAPEAAMRVLGAEHVSWLVRTKP